MWKSGPCISLDVENAISNLGKLMKGSAVESSTASMICLIHTCKLDVEIGTLDAHMLDHAFGQHLFVEECLYAGFNGGNSCRTLAIASRSGKCFGSRSTDGEVHTRLANRMLLLRSRTDHGHIEHALRMIVTVVNASRDGNGCEQSLMSNIRCFSFASNRSSRLRSTVFALVSTARVTRSTVIVPTSLITTLLPTATKSTRHRGSFLRLVHSWSSSVMREGLRRPEADASNVDLYAILG
ncbi:hypothetical protein KCU90_g43, partial [Aureobasidium melanogenum]